MIASHWWQGTSGRWYIHTIYSIAAELQLGACSYFFGRQNPDGTRVPLYVGQTKDGDNRLTITRHEKFAPALRLGRSLRGSVIP